MIIAEKAGHGTKAFFVKLEIPEVEWGAYVLSLTVNDRASGLSSRFSQVFSIE
jgi:hypothetical protein